jgi:hypothetical protein
MHNGKRKPLLLKETYCILNHGILDQNKFNLCQANPLTLPQRRFPAGPGICLNQGF